MKNSKEYSKKIRKTYRLLKRKHPKQKKVVYEEPVDALVYGIISENMSNTAAKTAIKRFDDYFVDLNDLRASSAEEIVEKLGEDTTVTRHIASTLTNILRVVFDKYNTVSLKSLHKMGKRPARQLLERISGLSSFSVNYCMLTSLQAHAIPLTKKMIEYLRKNELVHPDAGNKQIEGFLIRQIVAKNVYEFYCLLRRESESSAFKSKTRKKTTKRTKCKKRRKTKKKKTIKKRTAK